MADNLFPVVPDTGTEKAARLSSEVTGDPGRWVRLECQHLRHVQHPVEPGQELECPTCPPGPGGVLAARRVVAHDPERRRRARISAEPQAPTKAGAFAVEAVTEGGPAALVDDAGRMASELVATAMRRAEAPVELTVDTDPNMVRIEVRDDPAGPGTGKVASFELRDRPAAG